MVYVIPPQHLKEYNIQIRRCVSASSFETVCREGRCWSHRNISHSKSANRSSLSRWLSKAKVLLCCAFAVLLRASQIRIFLSDDFPGIVRLLFFWDVCAHQTQSNRQPCSPHVLSLQLDRWNNERYVELDVCQEFGGPFTPFSDRQLWWLLKPKPSFCRASCGNRERLRWGCGETRASLRSAAGPWVWLGPADSALPPALTHSKEAFYSDFDTFLMSEKNGVHVTAVCPDPAWYVKGGRRTSSKDVCWTSSDWLPWRVSDLLVWSDFCVRNRHLQILLLNTCLTLRLQWQCLRSCIRESRHWYSYARMDLCCHVRRDETQIPELHIQIFHASLRTWRSLH